MQRVVTIFILLFLLSIVFQNNLISAEQKFSRGKIDKNKTESSESEYIPDAIIVKFRPNTTGIQALDRALATGVSSIDNKIQRFGVHHIERVFKSPKKREMNLPDLSTIYKFKFSSPYDAKKVARDFANDPNVVYAEPVFIQRMYFEPNDPLFIRQWYLRAVKAPEAWDIEKGDSTVNIAIIDTGVDTDHPDLVDRIWVNEGEIPGNGADDDGNGFIDDINGWDFEKENADPNPDPNGVDEDGDGFSDGGVDHGTTMAGFVAATTNNAEGIAGLGWNCAIMPIKTLDDEGFGNTATTSEGIYYAANNGAHVINMSLGGNTPTNVQRDAVAYAYQKGCIIVAAGGNQASDNFRYPAAYEKVVGVGATGSEADLISSISNFGVYIDVMAPGGDFRLSPPSEMISTAYYDPTYGFNDFYRARTKEGYLTAGTSSSSAMVSGLMGLVKSQHPEWTNEQVIRQVVLTADNVDDLNPSYAGQLGSGRINAYRALTETNPPNQAPRIQLVGEVSFSDSVGGDNDMIFERGETIEMKVPTYRNFSINPGFNTVFTMTSDDTDLTIIKGIYDYGDFPPDTSIDIPSLFTFSVKNNARGKTATIFLKWQSDGGNDGVDSFRIIVGKIPILVVDDDTDDDLENDYFPFTERMYTNILDNFDLNYAVWDRKKLGALGVDQMTNFPIVVWLCSWAFPSLDPDDQLAISNFLDNGGSLFISGQDIGWDFNDPGGYGYEQRDFYKKYLHAIYYEDASPVNEVIGVPGDPIGNNLEFTAWQPGLPVDFQFPDEIEPDSGATTVFEYLGGKNHKFGIKYKGDHKVVYFGMGLEAIDANENTLPDEISPIRTEILGRVLDWLNFISHEQLRDTENLTESRAVVAQVNNSFALADLINVELHWRKKGESTFTVAPMTDIGNDQYSAQIPGPGESADIEYFIKLVNSYYEWESPQQAPDKFYSYFVGPDVTAPTFNPILVKSTINGSEPKKIVVGVKDNIGLDTSRVYIHYETNTLSDSTKLSVGENPEQFLGQIPPVFAYGDTVAYYFTAYDRATEPNRGESEKFAFIVGFENFESGLDNWLTATEGWGLDISSPYSGKYSINDSPNTSPYPLNRDVSIVTNFGLDLSKTDHAALKFWTRVFLEIDHDFGYVEVSNDGGATWDQVGDALNGFIGVWTQQQVSLSNYCGPGNSDVRIRFRMVSDANQGPPVPGWFIDDVQIIEGLNITSVAEDRKAVIPAHFALYQNYPNPFNPSTTIRFDVPTNGMAELKIYNIRGELVRTLLKIHMNAGSHAIQWDGRNDRGMSLSSGVYFYKLSMNDFNATRKLLLIK